MNMPWETVKPSRPSTSGSDRRKSRPEIDRATRDAESVYFLIKRCQDHPEMNLLSRLLVDMGNIETMDMADMGDSPPDEDSEDKTPYETWEQWTGLLDEAKVQLEKWREKLNEKIGDLDDDESPYDSARIHRTIMTFNHCAQLIMCLQQSMASISRTHQATFYNGRHHGQIKRAGEQAFNNAVKLYYYLNHKD